MVGIEFLALAVHAHTVGQLPVGRWAHTQLPEQAMAPVREVPGIRIDALHSRGKHARSEVVGCGAGRVRIESREPHEQSHALPLVHIEAALIRPAQLLVEDVLLLLGPAPKAIDGAEIKVAGLGHIHGGESRYRRERPATLRPGIDNRGLEGIPRSLPLKVLVDAVRIVAERSKLT